MRRLSAKYATALTLVLLALGLFYMIVAVMTTRLHLQTVDQALYRDLAERVLRDNWLPLKSGAASGDFSSVFDRLMAINPSAEFYLLDPMGRILGYSAPGGRVRLERVSMEPIHTFINRDAPLPILGDNPREPTERTVFSAAPISANSGNFGYLYVVLGGDAYRTAARMYESSHVLRLTLWLIAGGILAGGLVGAVSFRMLGRRLTKLADTMVEFEEKGFRQPPPRLGHRKTGDEVERLAHTLQRMSARIVDQIASLERVDSARRELFSYISHDLRTPLATQQAYLETLAMKWHELPGETRDAYLNAALAFGRRLNQITADLFELGTLDMHEAPLRPENFSVAELVQDVGQRFAPRAEEKGVQLSVMIDRPGTMITGDIGLIERLFANLIDNAIKFTAAGGTVRLSVEERADWIVCEVSDTGVGIPATDLKRIFERFHRVERKTSEVEGTGLGLAIAERIVELHRGTITAASVPGVRSTFTVRLPPTGSGTAARE